MTKSKISSERIKALLEKRENFEELKLSEIDELFPHLPIEVQFNILDCHQSKLFSWLDSISVGICSATNQIQTES